jgi:hypothetical protein
MKTILTHRNTHLSARLWFFTAVLLLAWGGQAQTVLLSSTPTNGATGVSLTAPASFTFSGPMSTSFLSPPMFYSTSPAGSYPVNSAWNGAKTILTCTPISAFPANVTISWQFVAYDANNTPVFGSGAFTTGTGGGSTGSGTNAVTAFAVGKINVWDQYSSAAPVTDTNLPYYFSATTTLASNRTANYISLTPPASSATNLTQNLVQPESYYYMAYSMSSNSFETAFPQGTYTFYVSATASNQTVPITLPTSMTQPNPPHVNNFAAAQSVNASADFTLSWDPFVGGGTTDYIYVAVGNWESPKPAVPGALNGTATSVTIPANSLLAGSNYSSFIGFYHFVGSSNATYTTAAYRATDTQFTLTTAGAGSSRPVLTNAVKSGTTLSFDIITTTGQPLTVVSSTNCALPLTQWSIVLSNTSPGTILHVTDTNATNRVKFYRVRKGG